MVSVSTGESGVAGDAGAFERLGVGAGDERKGAAPETPDRADVDRIVRRGGIELLSGRPALLGKDVGHVEVVRRIADRHGHDPFARLLVAGEFGDPVLDVADRAHAPERREDVAQRFAVHMGVTVDETGNDRPALQIDDARCRAGVRGASASFGPTATMRSAAMAIAWAIVKAVSTVMRLGFLRIGMAGRTSGAAGRRGAVRCACAECRPARPGCRSGAAGARRGSAGAGSVWLCSSRAPSWEEGGGLCMCSCARGQATAPRGTAGQRHAHHRVSLAG